MPNNNSRWSVNTLCICKGVMGWKTWKHCRPYQPILWVSEHLPERTKVGLIYLQQLQDEAERHLGLVCELWLLKKISNHTDYYEIVIGAIKTGRRLIFLSNDLVLPVRLSLGGVGFSRLPSGGSAFPSP